MNLVQKVGGETWGSVLTGSQVMPHPLVHKTEQQDFVSSNPHNNPVRLCRVIPILQMRKRRCQVTCPRSFTCQGEEPGPDTGACVLTQLCRDEAAGLPGRGTPRQTRASENVLENVAP